jgi:hypothetical protein
MTASGRDNSNVRPDTPGEMQAASLSSPFFREAWNASSKMSWPQFVARWETRHIVSRPSGRGGR